MADAFAILAEFLARITPQQHSRREREIVVEHESENIALSVINDGHCYRTWMLKFCKLGTRWITRDFDKAGKIIRIQTGFSAAVQSAVNYLVGRNDLDRDMNVWYDALARARFKLAAYYHNRAKELQHAS